MNLLLLGGTRFVGRHFVEEALAKGHTITLVHRGQTAGDLFPECRHLHMDRTSPEAWADFPDGQWDAVIDFSGYIPRVVRYSAEALRDRADKYLFISTISVYDTEGQTELDASSPLLIPPASEVEEVNAETYGGLKVACERVVQEIWGDSARIVRPGMIIGPYDHTDRFQHWIRQIKDNNRVDVPQRLDQPVQYIDARDLALLILEVVQYMEPGVYNGVGPHDPDTLGEMLEMIKSVVNPECELNPVPSDSIAKAPFSLGDDPKGDAIFRVAVDYVDKAGLDFRPLRDTISDIGVE
jgi:2'-hydroxyisoflavone reductase